MDPDLALALRLQEEEMSRARRSAFCGTHCSMLGGSWLCQVCSTVHTVCSPGVSHVLQLRRVLGS